MQSLLKSVLHINAPSALGGGINMHKTPGKGLNPNLRQFKCIQCGFKFWDEIKPRPIAPENPPLFTL